MNPKMIKKWADKIYKAKVAYYTSNFPIMTDREYDILEMQVKEYCPNHPILDMVGYDINGTYKNLTLKQTEELLNECKSNETKQ